MEHADFSTILLAAGRGVRMQSALPKVLHPVAGDPMVLRILRELRAVSKGEVRVVVGYGENLVRQVVEPTGAVCFRQTDPKGTADAVRSAQPDTLEGAVLILNGDHPLISRQDIKAIYDEFKKDPDAILLATAKLDEPKNYGRIVRHKGELRAIVEAKDASAETLKINEINTGIYMMPAQVLKELLPQINNQNAQKEFYLTDIIELAQAHNINLRTVDVHPRVSQGVNSQLELAAATKHVYAAKAQDLLEKGVILLDPNSTYVEETVQVGSSTVIYPNVFIKGETKIGEFCVLEPGVFLNNVEVASGVQLKAYTYIEGSVIGEKAVLGPIARIRPESDIGPNAKVGNFVELKKTKMGDGAKAGHLTYLGDAEVGARSNIGCGTITCNYAVDRKKYKTIIGEDVFVGSDSQFVAPIRVGDGAIIGSGSTITKDVPADALAVARGKQVTKEGYAKTINEKLNKD